MDTHNLWNYRKIIDKVVELWVIIEWWYNDSKNSITIKKEAKDTVDFVTQLDKDIEFELKKLIKTIFPDDSIVWEELEDIDNNSPFKWYIDPIDWTKYFSAWLPLFTTSIWLKYNWKSIFWIIYNPVWKDLIYGWEWIWAYRNDKKLEKIIKKDLNKTILYIDTAWVDKLNEQESLAWREFLSKLLTKVYRVRMFWASCFASFGTTNWFFSAMLDLFWKTKAVDIAWFSAILQELWYIEGKVMIWDIENVWIWHPETINELKNILITKN